MIKRFFKMCLALVATIITLFVILVMLSVNNILNIPIFDSFYRPYYDKVTSEVIPVDYSQPEPLLDFDYNFDYFEYGVFRCDMGELQVEMTIRKEKEQFIYDYEFINNHSSPMILKWDSLDDILVHVESNGIQCVRMTSFYPPVISTSPFIVYTSINGVFTKTIIGQKPALIPSGDYEQKTDFRFPEPVPAGNPSFPPQKIR